MKNVITINMEAVASTFSEKIEAMFKKEFIETAALHIRSYFRVDRFQDSRDKTICITQKGPGIEMIDTWITEKFVQDSETQERLKKYFDENYERIFHECMEKAIQHQCNKLAFQYAAEKGVKNDNSAD